MRCCRRRYRGQGWSPGTFSCGRPCCRDGSPAPMAAGDGLCEHQVLLQLATWPSLALSRRSVSLHYLHGKLGATIGRPCAWRDWYVTQHAPSHIPFAHYISCMGPDSHACDSVRRQHTVGHNSWHIQNARPAHVNKPSCTCARQHANHSTAVKTNHAKRWVNAENPMAL